MLWKNICHGLLKKYLPGVLLFPADDRMTVSSAIYTGCGQAARDFDGIWLDFGGRIRGDFLLFSCKFFWFVVCVSLPGSFANTDRAEWRVPSRYTTPAGRQPLVRCAHQRLCAFRRIGHSQKRCSYKQACIASFFLLSCPDSMLHHILNQNPIPSRRILHKHMCHRSCQLPILYDRRTAHEWVK